MNSRAQTSPALTSRITKQATARARTLKAVGAPKVGLLTVVILVAVAGLLGWMALEGALPIAGALYVVLFVAMTVIRPDLAFLVIFVESPMVWDLGLGPVKTSVADVSLILATPVLLTRFFSSGRRLASNPIRWPLALYLLVCVFSTLVNGTITESLTSMLQMALYMGLAVFVFANCVEHPDQIVHALYGLLATDLVLSLVVLGSRTNYVLGLHKNAIGSELDYAVVIAVGFWLAKSTSKGGKKVVSVMLLILGAGLVYSLSRGAWLGTIVGILVLMVLYGQMKLAIKTTLVLIPIFVLCWVFLPQQSKDYAVDFSSSARNIQARYASVAFAAERFKQSPLLGVGVGLRKMYDATNLVMSTLAETGILGLLTFLSIFALIFVMVWRTCRAADPKSTTFSLAAIGAALMAAKFAHGCVDHYWSRVMLPVWAMGGVAVWCHNNVLRKLKVPAGHSAQPVFASVIGPSSVPLQE